MTLHHFAENPNKIFINIINHATDEANTVCETGTKQSQEEYEEEKFWLNLI